MLNRTRTSIGAAAASLLVVTAGCASAPKTPEVPGIAVEPAQDFARPERARAKVRAEGPEAVAEEMGESTREPGAWRLRGELYLWVPSIDGDVGSGTDIDLSVSDMMHVVRDSLDSGLGARLVGSDGDWGFLAEVIRIRTEDEDGRSQVGGLAFEPEIDLDIIEVGVSKHLLDAHTFTEYSPAVSYHAIGGIRYFDADTKLNFGPGAVADAGDEEWFDPFVGAMASTQLTEHFSLDVRGDVGGFGLGEASDLSWRAGAVIRAKVYERLGAFAGWQAVDVKKERGSGPGSYDFDMTFSGPYFGLDLDF